MKRLLLVVLIGLAAACEHGTEPVAGTLNVSLTTPNGGSDAAILFTVVGPAALTSVSAPAGVRLFMQPPPFGLANRFVLTGTIPGGTILTIGVADVGKASAYTATVQQVSASNSQLRALTGYSLKLTP